MATGKDRQHANSFVSLTVCLSKVYCNQSGQLLDKSAAEHKDKLLRDLDKSMRLFYRETSGVTHWYSSSCASVLSHQQCQSINPLP